MDVIKEEGVVYQSVASTWNNEYQVRPFYYKAVVWIDSIKFLFGRFDEPGKLELMVEAETVATAASDLEVSGKVTVEKLIDSYNEKLSQHKVCGGEVLRKFKLNNLTELWQIESWVL